MPRPSPQPVVVPAFVGLSIQSACGLADSADVVLTSGRADGPPLGALTWPGTWVVTGQDPPAGAFVERGAWVVISFESRGGGDAGDREPREPGPPERRVEEEQRQLRAGGADRSVRIEERADRAHSVDIGWSNPRVLVVTGLTGERGSEVLLEQRGCVARGGGH
ncbi:MAG TPA: hypothetical protein VND62_04230 [Acidimicrobiales bacterium]|nr:hypothetical protein [Acidimicrobiales bacterium]